MQVWDLRGFGLMFQFRYQVSRTERCWLRAAQALEGRIYCAVMTVSSAYRNRVVEGSWGMSLVYKLNNVGLRTEPCGTPAAIVPGGERELWTLILKVLFLRNDCMERIKLWGNSRAISLYRRPSCHTLSKALSTSRKAATVNFRVLNP